MYIVMARGPGQIRLVNCLSGMQTYCEIYAKCCEWYIYNNFFLSATGGEIGEKFLTTQCITIRAPRVYEHNRALVIKETDYNTPKVQKHGAGIKLIIV